MPTLAALSLVLALTAPAPEPTVTLQLENVPVRHAIEEIAIQAKVNIALDPRVRGRVTANLRNVHPQFALRAVLGQVGASFRVGRNGTIRVDRVKRTRT